MNMGGAGKEKVPFSLSSIAKASNGSYMGVSNYFGNFLWLAGHAQIDGSMNSHMNMGRTNWYWGLLLTLKKHERLGVRAGFTNGSLEGDSGG